MKRDFDLIREILITLENEPNSRADLFARHFPEWESDAVNYHIWLLLQSGLIIGSCNHDYPKGNFMCNAICLTWQGHEFLASIRNDNTWHKIRMVLKEKSLELSLDAVKAAAAMLIKTAL